MPDAQDSQRDDRRKVKCQNCGFLAWRNKHTRELCEVELEYRQTADMSPTALNSKFDMLPLCFSMASDIRMEAMVPQNALGVIAKERHCESYTQWRQGLSPKEHAQMHWIAEQRLWQEQESERNRAHEREIERLTRQAEFERESQRQRDEERRHAEIVKGTHRTLVWTVAITFIGSVISGSIVSKVIEAMTDKW